MINHLLVLYLIFQKRLEKKYFIVNILMERLMEYIKNIGLMGEKKLMVDTTQD